MGSHLCKNRKGGPATNGGSSNNSGWILDCMRSHEQQHVNDMTKPLPCGGKNNPCAGQPNGPLGVPTDQAATLECAAYRAELQCLLPAGNDRSIQARRTFIQKQIANFCGGK